MELDHEKLDVSFDEIVYEYVNENDYAITQADAGTEPCGPSALQIGSA
ncbi:MAG: hypothetical protein GX804_00495 [Lentisphaerae bacterium]|nr:hypothetical protein [Lentisphaerota bacterium]